MIERTGSNSNAAGTLMPPNVAGNTARANVSGPGRKLRIALAHDWIAGVRGGEKVLEALANCLSREHDIVGLFTMFDDGGMIGPAVDALRRISWPGGRIPGVSDRLRRWMLPMYPSATRYLSKRLAEIHAREPIDLLFSTSSAAIKGMHAPEGVPHYCYCHSPARYVWSQGEEYAKGSPVRGLGLSFIRQWFKDWDRRTAANVTTFFANSRHIASEILRCFERQSKVIHPPVRTDFFTPNSAVKREDFWLYVGALESYKNVDLAIAAAKLSDSKLVIAGGGSDLARLQKLAGKDAEFVGRVSDDDLRSLYRRARLLVFPQCEDFGIVAVEAQACGTPVVALGLGGALDTVHDGLTGALFHERTPEALIAAAKRCEVDAVACRSNAERFGTEVFEAAILREVQALSAASGTSRTTA